MVANVTVLTDFVILDIPEDNSMSIILGRPFLNAAGVVLIATKAMSLFMLMVMSIRYTFQGNNLKSIVSILLENFQLLLLEVLNFLFLPSKRNMIFLLLGPCISPLR